MTSSTWEQTDREFQDSEERNSLFVKLKEDKDRIIGAFVGDPHTFFVHRDGALGLPSGCSGAGCPECAKGRRKALRFKVNFYVPSVDTMKILEGGPGMFRALLPAVKKFGPDKRLFEITRNGRARDPKTTYSIMPDEEISPEIRKKIERAPLHDLRERGAGSESAGPRENAAKAMGLTDSHVPF